MRPVVLYFFITYQCSVAVNLYHLSARKLLFNWWCTDHWRYAEGHRVLLNTIWELYFYIKDINRIIKIVVKVFR